MDEGAVERARERLTEAAAGRPGAAHLEAVLEQARREIATLAASAAEIDAALPARIGDAVRESVRTEAAPVGRQLAEVRGLLSLVARRLERLESDAAVERHARVDDLELLVDLVVSSWRSADERLRRIEEALEAGSGATVHSLDQARTGA